MKTPADMLTSDLRRMAAAIPVGWRAAILMAGLIVVFPILVTILIVDALSYDMPALRAPFRKAAQWMGVLVHHRPQRLGGLQHQPRIRHAH